MVRILHADDNATDRELVKRELGRAFPDLQMLEVRNQQELDLALAAGGFDLAITDYQLGWTTGLAVLTALKARHPDCPVVMFTGTGNEQVAVEAMKAGLDDYVVKSAPHAIRLVTAVRSSLEKADARRRAVKAERERDALLHREQAARAEAERLLREAKEADRRKDEFVMMLAHELRNPLAPISTSLEVLRASDADRRAVEKAVAVMARQIGHLARIIEDLLDVSRLIRGRVELRPDRIDLGRLARTALEDQRPAFDRTGVALAADLPDLPVWVNGDPTRLTQVIDNLLQNAAKFTDRGGTVVVRVRAEAEDRRAVLAVTDTGVGIDPDLLPRLFETFSQADRSLDRTKGGLGLGLSLVKGLVELHDGEVRAASDGPGRGAEFVVRLPLQPEPAAVTDSPAPPVRAAKRLRVLVVEDNRDAADSLKMLLEVFGYEVALAYTGPSGVETAREWGPDVVVCDIGLPGMSGYEVAKELRRHPATATARLIAVTGYGGEEDRRLSREAGFDAHLTKPADPTALQELLAQTGSTV